MSSNNAIMKLHSIFKIIFKFILTLSMFLPAICQAADIPMELNFYRNQYNPIGSSNYYYSVNHPLNRSAFPGWQFAVPSNQTLQVKNSGCQLFPIGKANMQAGVFSVSSNGGSVILHPNIPEYYFDGAHTCYATVALYDVNGNETKELGQVIGHLQKLPTTDPFVADMLVYNVEDNATSTPFAWCTAPYDQHGNPVQLPIFALQANGATPQLSNWQWDNDHYTMGNFSNLANINSDHPNYTKVGLFANQVTLEANFLGCNQVGEQDYIITPVYYTLAGQEEKRRLDESLDVSSLSKPVKLTIHWQKSKIKATVNAMHTISAGLQTKNRYEYGTFQAVIAPQSIKTGVLTSFYSFFGNGHIPMPGGTLPGEGVSNDKIANFRLSYNGGDQLQLKWKSSIPDNSFVLQVIQGNAVATSFIEPTPGQVWPSADFARIVQVQPEKNYVVKIGAYQGKRPTDDDIHSMKMLSMDVQSAPLLNWGYTWHEIDFELVKGPHALNYPPYFGPDGIVTPYTSADDIDNGVSLNAFFAGNMAFDLPAAWQKHRYCPNKLDPMCNAQGTELNVYDGNYHIFTYTWDHQALTYYLDGQLLSRTPIEFVSLGGPVEGPMSHQFQFNDAYLIDAEGKKHFTSPQYISLNLWVPTFSDWFGANYDSNALQGEEKIYADYAEIAWSPCVATSDEIKQGRALLNQGACDASRYIGQVYTADGKQQEQPNKALIWDFKKMAQTVSDLTPVSAVLWKNGWMYAPKMSFDNNNSTFVQNNALLEMDHGLRLCMMNQWNHIAVTGKSSTGCDGQPILPRPGEFNEGDTDPNQALLIVHARLRGNGAPKLMWRTLPGLLPRLPMNYPLSVNPGFLNNGWKDDDRESENGCVDNGTIKGEFCAGNGWFADSRFVPMKSGIEAVIMFTIQTRDINNQPITFTSLIASDADASGVMHYNGAACRVKYSLERALSLPLTLEAQQTYVIRADVDCDQVATVQAK